eukprot:Gb_08061 [translate_table: standard]
MGQKVSVVEAQDASDVSTENSESTGYSDVKKPCEGEVEGEGGEGDGAVLETVDDKFLNRLLTKEGPNGNSSRIYYTDPGSVPFGWEAEPGRPKTKTITAREESPAAPELLSPPPFLRSLSAPSLTKDKVQGYIVKSRSKVAQTPRESSHNSKAFQRSKADRQKAYSSIGCTPLNLRILRSSLRCYSWALDLE